LAFCLQFFHGNRGKDKYLLSSAQGGKLQAGVRIGLHVVNMDRPVREGVFGLKPVPAENYS
jgi:hypothetical protein